MMRSENHKVVVFKLREAISYAGMKVYLVTTQIYGQKKQDVLDAFPLTGLFTRMKAASFYGTYQGNGQT